MTSQFRVDPAALARAAPELKAHAERLAAEIVLIGGLGVHSGGEGLHTGSDDLDTLIGGRLDEVVEALAGAGELLQQAADKLATNATIYQQIDGGVVGGFDAIRW